MVRGRVGGVGGYGPVGLRLRGRRGRQFCSDRWHTILDMTSARTGPATVRNHWHENQYPVYRRPVATVGRATPIFKCRAELSRQNTDVDTRVSQVPARADALTSEWLLDLMGTLETIEGSVKYHISIQRYIYCKNIIYIYYFI